MNKEEMINALNSLAARIKAGQLDIDDVALIINTSFSVFILKIIKEN